MTKKSEISAALLETVKRIAPGFYTERDGGDWYVLTPDHDRIGEDFANRDDARRCLLWLTGEPLPKRWKVIGVNDLSIALDCGQGYEATLWTRSVRKAFPAAFAALNPERA